MRHRPQRRQLGDPVGAGVQRSRFGRPRDGERDDGERRRQGEPAQA
jgi:hypothetical protein